MNASDAQTCENGSLAWHKQSMKDKIKSHIVLLNGDIQALSSFYRSNAHLLVRIKAIFIR